jgi:hypothetical protein
MKGSAIALIAMIGVIAFSNLLHAEEPSDYEEAKAAIWAKELAIYDAWAETGLDYYIEHSSPHYVGWPPGSPEPFSLDVLKQVQANLDVPNQEKRQITFDDLALHDDTAVLYYTTHRTMLPDGTPIDELLHICHVWVRDDTGDWKLVGALGRVERD